MRVSRREHTRLRYNIEIFMIKKMNFDIRWHTRIWNYKKKSKQNVKQIFINLITTKKFAKLIILTQKNQKKFTSFCYINCLTIKNNFRAIRDRSRFVKCETLEIDKFELFEFIKNLMKIFSKTLFDNLNTYD